MTSKQLREKVLNRYRKKGLRKTIADLITVGFEVLWGKWYLRKCNSVGAIARAIGKPSIHNWGEITIGDRLQLSSRITRSEMVTYAGGRIEIGDNVFINYGSSISAHQLVKIGSNSMLGPYVCMMDNDYHSADNHDDPGLSGPIILGKNVWLGIRVVVLKGVTIGENSVIGAGSVVTKDIPPNVLAAGIPAKVIRKLTPRDTEHETDK